MQSLPKNSAYRSSITFDSEGVTVKAKQDQYQPESRESYHPFQVAKDYDIDIDAMNEDDP